MPGAEQADLRRSEDAARRVSQLEAANRELDAFARAVSLALQGPMRTVLGGTERLLATDADQLDEEGRRSVEEIARSVSRMEVLVNGLVSLASVSANELHTVDVDLSQLAREALAQLGPQLTAESAAIVVEEGLVVRGDRYWLWTLLRILLDNARKAVRTRPDARIEVGRSPVEHPSIYFVRDNGVGFDMGYVDRLFRPLQPLESATDSSALGLGLVLAKRIVRRHGGFIWGEGAIGEGATFYFTLG